MNIYWHEIKSLLRSAAVWAASLLALAGLYFSVYPGVAGDAAGFKKLLSGYPAPVRAAFGISIDNIASLLGFYSMVFGFITLCGAVQAMILGMSVLSRESRERTADFLLVKPVSRPTVVTAKLIAAVTVLLATDAVYFGGVTLFAALVKTQGYSFKLFFMVNATLLFIQLIFLAIGLFVSVLFTKLSSVLPLSLGIVFGFYIIGALLAAGKNADAARFFSPFQYFVSSYILKNARYELPYLLTGAAVTVAAVAASYVIYTKKDIHAVN